MSWLDGYWNYLVYLGFYRDVLSATVGGTVALGIAHLIQLLPGIRKSRKTQEVIADRLDTKTPGGLGDFAHGGHSHVPPPPR